MMRLATRLLWLLPLSSTSTAMSARPQDSPHQVAVQVVMDFLAEAEPDLEAFVAARLSTSLREKESEEDLVRALGEIHATLAGVGEDDILPIGPLEVLFVFPGPDGDRNLHARLDEEATDRLADLWIEDGPGLDGEADHSAFRLAPITWENLAERMREEEAAGFSGAVLVLREGEVVLNEGYGLADREKGLANTPETIFAVGSVPIDFTHAGILLLAEAGVIDLNDPITEYFEDVPEDKRAITLEHLRTGSSGLQDFLGMPGDGNPDHHYIDRAEAERRILGQELLFPPGQGRAHSHAAWGLLAAVLERVSGQTYAEFTRENVFEPLGMDDTGFFGVPLPEERTAVGYGWMKSSEINSPPHWGPTSWLVMGSGGMVSTTGDLLRFQQALHAGELLAPESLERYFDPGEGIAAAGDMFGFEVRYTPGPDSLFILFSNSGSPDKLQRIEAIAEALFELVR